MMSTAMGNCVILNLVLVLCLVANSLAESQSKEEDTILEHRSKDPLAEAFKSLVKEERDDFLVYFLANGVKEWAESQGRLPKFFPPGNSEAFINGLDISQENKEKFQNLNIPKDSSLKLLKWTKSKFNLTTRQVLDLLRTRQCQKGIGCNLPDIGEICCPW